MMGQLSQPVYGGIGRYYRLRPVLHCTQPVRYYRRHHPVGKLLKIQKAPPATTEQLLASHR